MGAFISSLGALFSILTNKFTIGAIGISIIALGSLLISQESIDSTAFFVMLGIGIFLILVSIIWIIAGRRRTSVPTLLPEGQGTPLEQLTNAVEVLNALIKKGDRAIVPPTGIALPLQPVA